MPPTHRWINQSQTQNLVNATIFLYINAGLAIFFGLLSGGIASIAALVSIGGIAGGYGIANEKKWGYYVALAVAFFPFVIYLLAIVAYGIGWIFSFNVAIDLIFKVILVVLLIDKKSREYVRIWFK